ncbi:MAG TPA: CAP domain-containing protein [Acidimicrobiia bacterium]|nr:CAP domain-containing protein [Acidimicrobiia bacterium]
MQRIPRRARRSVRALVAASVIAATGSVVAPAVRAAGTSPVTNASIGSVAMQLAASIVGLAATPTGKGYWRAGADGGVLTAGDARFYGSAAGLPHDIIVGMAATPTGRGYWLVDRKGAVFAFGDAPFRGSTGNIQLNKPIVGIAAIANGAGYWLVASDGGIFSFNAPFRGSTGSIQLNKPIVGMAAAANGAGYWLVASDGGVFAFGVPFRGSTGSMQLNKPIVGMAATPSGSGYVLVGSDGGLFNFGTNIPFFGSAANACPGAPAVAVAMSSGATGYWIAFADGRTYAFSPTSAAPKCVPTGASKTDRMTADLFARLNAERAARPDLGLAPLTWDPALATYATAWSADMAAHGFRHSAIGTLLGPYDYVGENIAAGSAGVTDGALHVAWMHSDGHRANILAPGFTRVGVGVYCAPGGGIWLTEDFGRPASAGAPRLATATPPVYPIARPDPGQAC